MSDEPDLETVTVNITNLLANLMDGLAPVMEAVIGYKKQCSDAGFTDEDASRMAADLHAQFLKTVFASG